MAKKKKTKKTKKKKTKAAKTSANMWDKFPKPSPQDVAHMINMKHGHAGPIMRSAEDAYDASDLRRPCGILSLDVATGGGFIAGKIHQVDGPEGTCKNYLLYRYMGVVQKHYGEDSHLAMACFESFVDKQFAQMAGCKIAMSEYDIEVSQRARKMRGDLPLTDEEVEEAMSVKEVGTFHIFEGPSENVLDGIVEATKANTFQFIGVDSWDSMMTYQEDDAPLGDTPQVASPATLQTRWSKKIQDAFNPVYRCPECGFSPLTKEVTKYETMNFGWQCPHCKWKGLDPGVEVNETTIYCIRQVRAKIMAKIYGRPYDSKGAHALLHANHVRVSVHSGQFIKEGKNPKKLGKEISWDIRKAKAGAREGATGKFDLYFRPLEVDVAADILATCIKYGVIVTSPGGWYEIPEVEKEEGEIYKVRSKNAMLETLERNPGLVDVLQELVYIKADLSHVRFR